MWLNERSHMWLSRLLPYWLTVLAASWSLAFFYIYVSEKATEKLDAKVQKIFVLIKDQSVLDWKSELLGFMTPILLASSLATLLLTSVAMPSWRVSWVNKFFALFRRFKLEDAEYGAALSKKNQFGVGQPNFNLMAFWLVFLPGIISFFGYLNVSLETDPEYLAEGKSANQIRIESTSYLSGWTGVVVLAFFLIPVSRHSVLLVAMNWSPVHALRIHVWAGYLSYFFIFLHGLLLAVSWFMYIEGPIYNEFIPDRGCWLGPFPEESDCLHQFFNLSGLVAFAFMTVLWASSLNWFRRKWYRLFYVLHVLFGSLTLLASVWHFEFIALYLLPSLLYYFASTTPTLVQALASRYRGGVKILRVVTVDDTEDCLELHVSVDPTAHALLVDDHPSKFVKLCVPKISIVWHPFTVYGHPLDPTTLRILFRAVGPFTKQLHSSLVAPERPVTMLDGFYRGGDHCQEALSHDHVSIVAGGVAISPFFSMMNTILKILADRKAAEVEPSLRSMTLYWSCREAGLLSFVKTNYLEDMARAASGLEGFNFKVKIFHTDKNHVSKETDLDDYSSNGRELNSKEAIVSSGVMNVEPNLNQSDAAVASHEKIAVTQSRQGHDMELARMMPARFRQMRWNLPYFAVFSGSVWLGFHLEFYPYDSSGTDLKGFSEQTWITFFVFLLFVGVAIVIEVTVLKFRKHWPAPRTDDFDIVSSSKMGATKDEETPSLNAEVSAVFEIHHRRPGPEDVFVDARLANAPGLFMCGPASMVEMVRKEARRENSYFGLTRYVLYEETFEM